MQKFKIAVIEGFTSYGGDSTRVFCKQESIDDKTIQVTIKDGLLHLTKKPPMSVIDPLLTFSLETGRSFLQAFMDGLYESGYRPSGVKEGFHVDVLSKTEYHLEDMREQNKEMLNFIIKKGEISYGKEEH